MATFMIWTGRSYTFKSDMTKAQAANYVEACKRNYRGPSEHAHFTCEEIDPTDGDEKCSGLTGDPRHSGTWCLCRI